MTMVRPESQSGFTLVEVLVAFSILLIGMTAIIAMFATGLKLERKGRAAFDAAVVLDELRPAIRAELANLEATGAASDFAVENREVPGYAGLYYSVQARPISGATAESAWLVEIRVAPAGTPPQDAFSFGWLPFRVQTPHATRVRQSLEDAR